MINRNFTVDTRLDYTQQTSPTTLVFTQVRGDSLVQTVNVSANDFDFTGTTARCHFKRDRSSRHPLFIPTVLVSLPSMGRLICTIQATSSQTNLIPNTYYADLELTIPPGRIKTVAFLNMELIQDVSN